MYMQEYFFFLNSEAHNEIIDIGDIKNASIVLQLITQLYEILLQLYDIIDSSLRNIVTILPYAIFSMQL